MSTYLSSLPTHMPESWRHLETAERESLPTNSRHKVIPTGTRFGRLVIDSEPFKLDGYDYIYYECQCDCGNHKVVRSGRLSQGTVSCGCRMRESSSENGGLNKKEIPSICACGAEVPHAGTACRRCQYQKHKKRHNKRHKEWLKEQEQDPHKFIRLLFSALKNREARPKRNNGKERQITIDTDFLCALWDKQEGRCALAGIPMMHEKGDASTVSIDRIDSNGDYTPENVQLVCYSINLAKRNFGNDHILEFINKIRKN